MDIQVCGKNVFRDCGAVSQGLCAYLKGGPLAKDRTILGRKRTMTTVD